MMQETSEIPEWALRRVCDLTNVDGSHYDVPTLNAKVAGSYSIGQAFARYIAEHESPPVDPLLIEAREIAGKTLHRLGASVEQIAAGDITSGKRDDAIIVHATLAALRRGIELAHAGES